MDEGLEVELKLEIDVGDGDGALAAAAGGDASGAASRERLVSTYYDTADGALAAAGFSLRVRENALGNVQTIKANGAAAGLFARPEWETPVEGTAPRVDMLAGPFVGVIGADTLAALEPAFRATVDRTIVDVAHDDARIEVALDRGTIGVDASFRDFCEIELELKAGSPAALFALARRIDAAVPARIGVLTKSERGFRARAGRDRDAARADTVPLAAGMGAATGFATIAHACLRQFRLNEAILAVRDDATALHQARVGIRRLRSAFSLFKPLYDSDETAVPLRDGLRTLAGTLGEARDLDVLGARISDDADRRTLAQARADAYARAADALASDANRALMLDLVEWLAIGPWRSDDAIAKQRGRPIGAAAARILDRFRRRLKRDGRDLSTIDDEARHRVRIEAKKLRYATEFFAALYPDGKAAKRHRRFLSAIEGLQDDLGALNDRAAGRDHAERLGIRLADVAGPSPARLLADAEDGFDALMDAKRYWR